MKRLFFKQGEKTFKYTVIEYQIVEIEGKKFYIFIDVYDGNQRKLSSEMYMGEEEINEKEVDGYARRN